MLTKNVATLKNNYFENLSAEHFYFQILVENFILKEMSHNAM